jgi:hypothetical protein
VDVEHTSGLDSFSGMRFLLPLRDRTASLPIHEFTEAALKPNLTKISYFVFAFS